MERCVYPEKRSDWEAMLARARSAGVVRPILCISRATRRSVCRLMSPHRRFVPFGGVPARDPGQSFLDLTRTATNRDTEPNSPTDLGRIFERKGVHDMNHGNTNDETTGQMTIIGADTLIKGEMTFQNAARILGKFEGKITSQAKSK